MSDPRDNTIGMMLEEIRITYTSVIRAIQLHNNPLQASCSKPYVELLFYTTNGKHVISLACERYSMCIILNDCEFPECILDEYSDKTLLEAFSKNIKRLDSKVTVFYEELKIFNNHYQQLSQEAKNELFGIQ